MRRNLIGAHVLPQSAFLPPMLPFLSEKPRQRENNVDLVSFRQALVLLKADPLKTLLD